ncbi:protein of unknown function (plasmid) [Cupriavidus taiwanensis]|nr:protein of unknown function [Cupriavidus taiwanensis]
MGCFACRGRSASWRMHGSRPTRAGATRDPSRASSCGPMTARRSATYPTSASLDTLTRPCRRRDRRRPRVRGPFFHRRHRYRRTLPDTAAGLDRLYRPYGNAEWPHACAVQVSMHHQRSLTEGWRLPTFGTPVTAHWACWQTLA